MAQVNLYFPYLIDTHGQTAVAADEDHIRDMIGQVLFTAPGERVNRPTFGSGLPGLVFEPNAPDAAAATQFQAHGALQLWLGDVIEVQDVTVEADGEVLRVLVRYLIRRTQQRRLAEFRRPGVAL
jgi:phage baseplate assembly protein W